MGKKLIKLETQNIILAKNVGKNCSNKKHLNRFVKRRASLWFNLILISLTGILNHYFTRTLRDKYGNIEISQNYFFLSLFWYYACFIWSSNIIPLKFKAKIVEAFCLSFLMYGGQRWIFTQKLDQQINSFAKTAYRLGNARNKTHR